MKTAIYLIALSFLLAANACRRNDTKPAPVTPKEQLPPYTETGANTFGCLIDGEVFVPGKPAFSIGVILECQYQTLNYNEKYFSLAATNFITKKSVSFGTNKKEISVAAFDLGYYFKDSIYGGLGDFSSSYIRYFTNPPQNEGKLIIQHFDTINQIISGTFWFDAIDTVSNRVVHVTDGRFDVQYTR